MTDFAPPEDPEGSSPLTRGKRPRQVSGAHGCGLIPAHAGKTSYAATIVACFAAHPRSRGENERPRSLTRAGPGSSPLTRGKPRHHRRDTRSRGLIPAHAGKTKYRTITGTISGAHPRSRGENPPPWLFDSFHDGSSPLTRGKRDCFRACDFCRGLIPAHAGKTRDDTQCRSFAWAHPRSRGENP